MGRQHVVGATQKGAPEDEKIVIILRMVHFYMWLDHACLPKYQ